MDRFDVEILRRIAAGPFVPEHHLPASVSPSGLAKAMSVSVETVRRRIQALQAEGLLEGPVAWPNFRHLGLRAATYHFRGGERPLKGRALETVAKLDRVIDAFAMLGGDVCVDLCYSDEEDLARRLAAIREQLDAPAPLAFFEYALPSIGRRLVATDWRILASVRRDPSRTLDDVAVELGLSRRTVKRRLAAMQAQGAVDLAYMFNPGRLRGGLMVYLLVGMREASTRTEARAVVNAFKDRWIAQWSPPDARLGHVVLVTTADSAAEVEAQRREAESLGSVAHAQALVLHDAASAPAWIDEEIARRAGAAPTVGRLTVAPEVVRR